MDVITTVLFVAGMGLLLVGGEMLVRGASGLAAVFGISPLVIGLTVVAFGTSSPELAVSLQAALAEEPGIGLGNVVGSNIFNVLFILGIAALISPLVVAQRLIWFEVPLMIGVSVLVLLLGLDERIGRLDGALLFAGVCAYVAFALIRGREEGADVVEEYEHEFAETAPGVESRLPVQIGLVVLGLGGLLLGSRWLVDGAVDLAEAMGLSELIIGLTIVAMGTSLPEVATSVIAALRGERDIAVGNVVGSNLFNLLAVLGATALVASDGVAVPETALQFDIPVMIVVAVACLPIFFTGHVIARWEGAVFLGYYAAYTLYLLLDVAESDALPVFTVAMVFFVLPLTAITLVVLFVRAFRRQILQRELKRDFP